VRIKEKGGRRRAGKLQKKKKKRIVEAGVKRRGAGRQWSRKKEVQVQLKITPISA